MEFAVSRDGTTLVTLHGGTDTTACDDATAELEATLSAENAISDWEVTAAEVYEHPAAPFDPYTITVSFTVTATVEADDAEEATTIGASAIDEALENAGVESVSYTTSPTVSAA